MFEVGKQYKGLSTGKVVEVLFVGTECTFVKVTESGGQSTYRIGAEFTVPNEQIDFYEYVEPEVIKTCTFGIHRGGPNDEFMFYTRGPFNPPAPPMYHVIGAIEITESSKTGLTVKVLP